jgi:hypothetical protein
LFASRVASWLRVAVRWWWHCRCVVETASRFDRCVDGFPNWKNEAMLRAERWNPVGWNRQPGGLCEAKRKAIMKGFSDAHVINVPSLFTFHTYRMYIHNHTYIYILFTIYRYVCKCRHVYIYNYICMCRTFPSL